METRRICLYIADTQVNISQSVLQCPLHNNSQFRRKLSARPKCERQNEC